MQQEKSYDLLVQINQMRWAEPNIDGELQWMRAESHLDFSTQKAKINLSRLLNRNAQEELLNLRFQRKLVKNGPD